MKCAIPISYPVPQVSDDPASGNAHGQPARCMHRWPSGRRCRQVSESANSNFCATHAAVESNRHSGDRAEVLLTNSDSLHSVEGIHNSLAELYVMVAEDKISPAAPPSLPTSANSCSAPCPPSNKAHLKSSSTCPAPATTPQSILKTPKFLQP
jgi:hypothetical protein